MGFYTARDVTADDAESAGKAAVELLLQDPKLDGCLNDPSDPPQILVEYLVEIGEFDADEEAPGFVFYTHEHDA